MIIEQVADHAGKDKQSHLLKHAVLRNHRRVDLSNIEIIVPVSMATSSNEKFLRHFTSSNIDHH